MRNFGALSRIGGLQQSLFRIELRLWQKFALFLTLSVAFAALRLWVRSTIDDVGPAGYLVAFLISFAGSATILVPAPTFAVVVILAEDLNVLALGIAAGVGGTLGELSGYYLGTQCRIAIAGNRLDRITRRAMDRTGGAMLVVAGLLPVVPVDIAGLIAGSTGYPVKRFLFWLALGKVPMTILLLFLAVEAIDQVGPFRRFLE